MYVKAFIRRHLKRIFSRFGFSRVTSLKTSNMQEFTYITLADLDRSGSNRVVTEIPSEGYLKCFECPHHVIVKVIKIFREVIEQHKLRTGPAVLQNANNIQAILERNHEEVIKNLTSVKTQISEILLRT